MKLPSKRAYPSVSDVFIFARVRTRVISAKRDRLFDDSVPPLRTKSRREINERKMKGKNVLSKSRARRTGE